MPALEFCLPPGDLPHLLRQNGITQRGRAVATDFVWHDTATGDLAADHLSLCSVKGTWRLERASPVSGDLWPPATPAPLVAEGAKLEDLGSLPGPLMPVAGFHGQQRTMALAAEAGASLVALEGTLRGVAQERAICRVVLRGSASLLLGLSGRLAGTAAIEVPRWSLATEATALARNVPPPPRRTGGPAIQPGTTVANAVALVIGHLTDVILAGVPGASAGENIEAVHAMRVAVRRLRSAFSVFGHATDGPAFQAVLPQLERFGTILGVARDWDVFLNGTGQAVAAALTGDRRLPAMLTAAAKRREAAYATLRAEFASPAFRQLAVALVQLAALRPWHIEADAEWAAVLASPVEGYATTLLGKRHKRMLGVGSNISALPTEELHALRKQGKKLRYAAEFFGLLQDKKDTRRFIRRLAGLQEALGHLNDAAAAAGLMDSLRGGADRQFAAGAVLGFTAARSGDTRAAIASSWTKFRKTEPFWD